MQPTPPADLRDVRRSIRVNRWVIRTSRHWLTIILIFLLLYVGLSLTAPLFMKAGQEGIASAIYTLYAPMCHQFAFRSWFFFGDQIAYPLSWSGSDLAPFEVYAAQNAHFDGVNLSQWSAELQSSARSFHGDDLMGYKTALCERDVMIYGTMLLAGLLFSRVRGWLRPAPLWLYLILGLAPMGLDGFSQLFSYPPFEFWPVRETIPALRAISGGLFGLMNVWLAFPYLESSMRETVEAARRKLIDAEEYVAESGG